MALKLPEFFTRAGAKSRVAIVFGAIAVVGAVIYFVSLYLSGDDPNTGRARLANAPSGLQSVPGSQLSPEYYRALMQANTQASKQAQITGGSAVPTLINASTTQVTTTSTDCGVVCPGDDNADVTRDINDLVKQGQLSKDDASKLLALAASNTSPTDYENALNDLVRQGKLKPDQARKLLAEYQKQYANRQASDSAKTMDALIASGALPIDAANGLLALQKKNASVGDYSAELNRLVREGKISPETAARLLAQYTQQQGKAITDASAAQLRAMAAAGQITPDVADTLTKLQQTNAPLDQYKATLDAMVASGKMTPATEAKLLADYQRKRLSLAPASTLAQIMANNPNPALAAQGQRLMQLQANNASAADYSAELKRAVQAGLISPDDAARLLQEYQALLTPGAVATGTDVNVPGGDDVAQLQARLRQQELETAQPGPVTTVTTTQQFDDARAQNEAQQLAEAQKLRQQRIQDLMSRMASQASALVTAWAPPVMEHKEGSYGKARRSTTRTASGARVGPGGPGQAGGQPSGPPLIKAGTIMFAILDTGVDSDYPNTPVMATIVSGKFKGARLLGKLALETGQDKVALQFNLMDMESWPRSKQVTAFAMDPDTARTVMASEVNYHYLLRYGSMFASSFITGYASAITQSGSTTTTGIFGTTTTHPELSPRNRIAVGLGQVGTTLGNAMASYFNTPATVKVHAGVALGILFMAEVPSEDRGGVNTTT